MKKTLQEIKRETLKELFEKILSSKKVKFEPLEINVKETWDNDFTCVNLSYKIFEDDECKIVSVCKEDAKGFVDGIFKACYSNFSEEAPSLANIRLHDYKVHPSFAKRSSHSCTDAKVKVAVMMDVKDHGIAEFTSVSRSLLHSSFVSILSAFQFYVNCERSFKKIQMILGDARDRSRADIEQQCMSDLYTLTTVNNYVR